MTPREILEKYGLKTDVKSVKERIGIERNDKCGYWESSKQYAELNHLLFFGNIIDECFQADLDLLCEMAERAEKVEEEYLTLKNICESLDSGDENWKLLVVEHIIDYLNELKEKELEELK